MSQSIGNQGTAHDKNSPVFHVGETTKYSEPRQGEHQYSKAQADYNSPNQISRHTASGALGTNLATKNVTASQGDRL